MPTSQRSFISATSGWSSLKFRENFPTHGYKRLEYCCAGLENSSALEGPVRFRNDPVGMSLNHVFCSGEIRCVVSAKTQIGPGGSAGRKRVEEVGLHNPIFVMTALRPWIRKKDKYPLENNLRRQRVDEFSGFGLQENEIRQLRAVTFTKGAVDSVADQIDADAELGRMGRGVVGEEMPVAGTDFQRDTRVCGEQICQFLLEGCSAGGAMGDKLCGAGGIIHGAGF